MTTFDTSWTARRSVPGHVVAVVGPTASGKSALATDLAEGIGGEIVNADAYQLYRHMDIGTAKPSAADRQRVKHHLFDVLDIAEVASVAVFQRRARAAIADCHRRGVTPVVVGGSSLYVRAVLDPLDFPGTDPVIREKWHDELQRVGAHQLHQQLARLDPAAACEILPTNGRRITRALEVIELTGGRFAATMPPHESIYQHVTLLGLDVDSQDLDRRVAERVARMWDDGLIEEVRALRQIGLDDSPTASRAIGYQQALAYLAGTLTADQAQAETVTATRQFARRQIRLFRRDHRIRWLSP